MSQTTLYSECTTDNPSSEYPDFFTKLYSLLDRDVLHVRYRPRFFRLLELFMGSSYVP